MKRQFILWSAFACLPFAASCTREASSSSTKEFEESDTICQDVAGAIKLYASAPLPDKSVAQYQSELMTTESEILTRLIAEFEEKSDPDADTSARLVKYQRNLNELDRCPTTDTTSALSIANNDTAGFFTTTRVKGLVGVGTSGLAGLCNLMNLSKATSCKLSIVTGLCGKAINAAGALGTDAVAGEDLSKDTSKALAGGFVGSAVSCLKALLPEQMDAVKAQFAAMEGKFLGSTVEGAVEGTGNAAGDALAKKPSSLKADIAKAIASAACQQGAGLIADRLSTQRDVDFDNACNVKFGRSEWASCLRSAKIGCDALMNRGAIDLNNFFNDNPDSNWDDVARVLASGAATAGCQLGGTTSQLLCTIINHAASQIKDALNTGNNDWAHCARADQMGACVNKTWRELSTGVLDADAKSGISQPVSIDGGEPMRKCCLCMQATYSKGTFRDSLLSSTNALYLVEEGSAGERSCTARMGQKRSILGTDNYLWDTQCSVEWVKGTSCPLPGTGSMPVDVEVTTGTRKGVVTVSNAGN